MCRLDIYKKSFEILKKIISAQKRYGFKVVLIGGWAVWIYSRYLKSKDIDLIIDEREFWKLKNLLIQMGFSETYSEHLGKKGFAKLINTDKVEIDVYEMRIGNIRVEPIIKGSIKRKVNGLEVLIANVTDLFVLKSISLLERMGSAKGEKDISDLLALLDKHYSSIDWNVVKKIGKEDLKKVFEILLGNYKTTQKFYRMSLNKYKRIKSFIKNHAV